MMPCISYPPPHLLSIHPIHSHSTCRPPNTKIPRSGVLNAPSFIRRSIRTRRPVLELDSTSGKLVYERLCIFPGLSNKQEGGCETVRFSSFLLYCIVASLSLPILRAYCKYTVVYVCPFSITRWWRATCLVILHVCL